MSNSVTLINMPDFKIEPGNMKGDGLKFTFRDKTGTSYVAHTHTHTVLTNLTLEELYAALETFEAEEARKDAKIAANIEEVDKEYSEEAHDPA